MGTFITVITTVLVFGFLIFIHEFGHFISARIFGVKVEEFSIGMGPRLLWYESKKSGTIYSLSMLPIGGFVSMTGETEESDDPDSFSKKPAWQRFIITFAGAFVNIVFGFIAMLILTSIVNIGGTTVGQFVDKEEYGFEVSSSESGLMLGDEIISVEGVRVSISDELSYQIMRHGNEPVDLVVIRDGKRVELPDVVFPKIESSGQTFGSVDFRVYAVKKDIGTVISHSWIRACHVVRMCWESIIDLITGRYTFAAVSGPVGISSAIGDAAKSGFPSLLYIVTVISINLGVMNLLPIPALDGGRLIMLLVEMISGKRLPEKVEGIINGVGLAVLLGLSVIIMIKDVIQLF